MPAEKPTKSIDDTSLIVVLIRVRLVISFYGYTSRHRTGGMLLPSAERCQGTCQKLRGGLRSSGDVLDVER